MNFNELHNQSEPLFIGNVWDVASAKAAENAMFLALGTSSAAMAAMLGYDDGEKMSFAEVHYVVKRIIANTNLPLSVDLEAGYSRNVSEIVDHIQQLFDLGVVGINIEDSLIGPKGRELVPADQFSTSLKLITKALKQKSINIFLNVRTDTFLLNHPNAIKEAERRIELYEQAGVDGVFVPGITAENDIKAIVAMTQLPINVMCMPELPNFKKLAKLGVKRISMGNFAFDNLYKAHQQTLGQIVIDQSFDSIFKC
ncbi:MAG: isocitrate lyase/phosphoenolpyruvate mutase family protein [Anaerolineae bacterium]